MRLRVLAVTIAYIFVCSTAVQGGALDRLRMPSRGLGATNEPPAHPICGVEKWIAVQDSQSGATIRFPLFKRCRHLLTVTGYAWSATDDAALLLLAETVALIFERVVFLHTGHLWIEGGPVSIGVPTWRWIPAGCEWTLGTSFGLTPEILQPRPGFGPGTPARTALWAACQQRAAELFVAEYATDPDVATLNRLSAALDALDLDSAIGRQRLQRARLLLLSPQIVPRYSDLLAIIEGTALPPSPGPSHAEAYRFTVETKADARARFRANGFVTDNFGARIVLESGTINVPVGTPVAVQAGLCFQPLQTSRFQMIWTMTPTSLPPSPDGERHLQRQELLFSAFPPPGMNLRRYWPCFQLTASGVTSHAHAGDAVKKGCKGCD